MGSLREEYGFAKAFRYLIIKSVLSLEFAFSLIIATVSCLAMFNQKHSEIFSEALPILTGINVTIAGIIFTGLTLVATLFSSKYLSRDSSEESGHIIFFRPYIFALGTQILALIICIFLVFCRYLFINPISFVLLGIATLLTTYGLFELLALGRNVIYHVLLRNKMGE